MVYGRRQLNTELKYRRKLVDRRLGMKQQRQQQLPIRLHSVEVTQGHIHKRRRHRLSAVVRHR